MKPNYDKNLYYKSNMFSSISYTKEISKPLKEIDISYFCYLEFFRSREFRCLVSEEKVATYYIENNAFIFDPVFLLHAAIPVGFYPVTPYYQEQSGEVLDLWKYVFRDFGYPNIFLFVPDNHNGIMKQVYAFGMEHDNFFHQGLAEAFVSYFHDQTGSLIQHLDKRPLPPISEQLSIKSANLLDQICVFKKDEQIKKFLKEINFTDHKCSKFGQINRLSPRETQCLNFTIQGKRAKEISYFLGLKQKTVEFYLDRLRAKLNCKNKMDLLVKVLTFDCMK